MTDTALGKLINQQIAMTGPMSIANYMALCLTHPELGYYKNRDPLGAKGDFITAPEISQAFGEMIGLWIGGTWEALGRPKKFNLVELGPGRGTLMMDAMRVLERLPGAVKASRMVLFETNAKLITEQQKRLKAFHPLFIDDLDRLDDDVVPHIFIANEFFDALPIRQFQKADGAWHERLVGTTNEQRTFGLSPTPMPADTLPPAITKAENDAVWEVSFAAREMVADIAARIQRCKGAMLAIDYGYARTQTGETLQALGGHTFTDPLTAPGENDLTAHVDFGALSECATKARVVTHPLISQHDFLRALGITQRLRALTTANPDRTDEMKTAVARLMDSDQMGQLFKCFCISSKDLAPYPFQTAEHAGR